jgi:hypothetical protein
MWEVSGRSGVDLEQKWAGKLGVIPITGIILATWEVEIMVLGQLRKKVPETPSQPIADI